nr:MAG TPA: hypothetical protein [Caudoviricetes sp.]
MKASLIRIVLFFIGPAIRFEIERYRAADERRSDEAVRHMIEFRDFVDERMLRAATRNQTKPSARSSDS